MLVGGGGQAEFVPLNSTQGPSGPTPPAYGGPGGLLGEAGRNAQVSCVLPLTSDIGPMHRAHPACRAPGPVSHTHTATVRLGGGSPGSGEQAAPAGRWPLREKVRPHLQGRGGLPPTPQLAWLLREAPCPARLGPLWQQREAVSSQTCPGFLLTPWLGGSWDRQGQFRQPDSLASEGSDSRHGGGGCGDRAGARLWAPGPGQPGGSWRSRGAGGPGERRLDWRSESHRVSRRVAGLEGTPWRSLPQGQTVAGRSGAPRRVY